MTTMRHGLLLVGLLLAGFASTREQSKTSGKLVLQPCNVPHISDKAECGNLEVFENRTTRSGRMISLQIIRLPATGKDHAADPLFYIPGGPGSPATEDAPGIAQIFARVHERHDLVFVDQRGTGGSHALNCELYNASDPQSYLGYFFPLDDVKKCRRQLEATSDLTLYTTPIAMDDLDEVRAALGYDKINIFGGSYGTRAALVYLRQHPQHVRTLTLQGITPTNQFMPHDFPQGAERALQGVLKECAADEACHAAFPNLQAETKSLLARLLQGPVEVEVSAPNSSDDNDPSSAMRPANLIKVKLSRNLAAEAIRYMLYNPVSASRVPLIVHQAATGNFRPLAENALLYRQRLVASGSNGLYLSITCAEDLPWIKPGEGERLAANTFLGDYRLRQQREACALWPRASVPPGYSQPVRGSAAVLMLTGEWDPVTPPANGDTAARYLPNSLHIVVPHGAHGFAGLQGIDCVINLIAQFIEAGASKNLNTDCVTNVRRQGFAVK
jgi:pimeloyl-ACP methyl ester carboxylesterase